MTKCRWFVFSCVIVGCALAGTFAPTARANHESAKQPPLWTPVDEVEQMATLEAPGGWCWSLPEIF